jgi:hypothetical protein
MLRDKRPFKVWIASLLPILATLSVMIPFEAQAWQLEVDLSQSSFGAVRVCASIEGGYGYGPITECTSSGRDASVRFDIGNSIEANEYEVCVWEPNVISSLLNNCDTFTATGDDRYVSEMWVD